MLIARNELASYNTNTVKCLKQYNKPASLFWENEMIFAQNKNLKITITYAEKTKWYLHKIKTWESDTNEFKESKETVLKYNCSPQLQITIEFVSNQLINK